MDELIDEIISLRADVEMLKGRISSDTAANNDSTGSVPESVDTKSERLEYKLGNSISRLVRNGPESAARTWLNSTGLRNNFLSWSGIGAKGLGAGLIGGFWSYGVDLLIKGISKLFTKQRSPLLKAGDIRELYYINEPVYSEPFSGFLKSELFRGRADRVSMRELSGSNDSLERLIKRGVVGL